MIFENLKGNNSQWKRAAYTLAFSGVMTIIFAVSSIWHTTIAAPHPLPTPAPVKAPPSNDHQSSIMLGHPDTLDNIQVTVHPNHAKAFINIVEYSATRQTGVPLERVKINENLTQVRMLVSTSSLPDLKSLDSPHHSNMLTENYQEWARDQAENTTSIQATDLVIYSVLVKQQRPTAANHWLMLSSLALTCAGVIVFATIWITGQTSNTLVASQRQHQRR